MKTKLSAFGSKAATLLAASILAALSMNWISSRVFNCPIVWNPIFGTALEPGAKITWQVEGDGAGVWLSNNVRRAALPTPGEKPVLLVLGDSFAEGLQVHAEESFGHLLEERLRANSTGRPAVLSVGRSGCSMADYVAYAPVYRRLFQPDWVFVQVREDDFLEDAWQDQAGKTTFRKRTDGSRGIEAVLPQIPPKPGRATFFRGPLGFLRPLSLFWNRRCGEFQAWVRDRDQPWFHANIEASRPRPEAPNVSRYPVEEEIRLLAEAYQRRVTLLFLPPFDPQDLAGETECERLTRQSAARQGIRFVSLRDRFVPLARAGFAPYGFSNTRFNAGHWNRSGHAAAADLLQEDFQHLERDLH